MLKVSALSSLEEESIWILIKEKIKVKKNTSKYLNKSLLLAN